MSPKPGIWVGSTAATSPLAISRFVASPEAETPSYTLPPPWRRSVTISSEVLPIFVWTLQPVSASNGWTQSYCLLFEPSSA